MTVSQNFAEIAYDRAHEVIGMNRREFITLLGGAA
jgi:hypothetical protein